MEELLMKNFCLITGLDTVSAQDWQPLVLACWQELKGKLKVQVNPELHRERLALVCAALASRRMEMMQGTNSSRVQVGDISFSNDSKECSREILHMVDDLLDSQGICIKGVEIN